MFVVVVVVVRDRVVRVVRKCIRDIDDRDFVVVENRVDDRVDFVVRVVRRVVHFFVVSLSRVALLRARYDHDMQSSCAFFVVRAIIFYVVINQHVIVFQ